MPRSLVADAVDATVSSTIRETVAAVTRLRAGNEGVTIASVAKELKLDRSTTWRRVKAAISKGFIKNLEEKRGHPARLVIGDPLPEEVSVLPLPETLTGTVDGNGDATVEVPQNKEVNHGGCRVAAETEGYVEEHITEDVWEVI